MRSQLQVAELFFDASLGRYSGYAAVGGDHEADPEYTRGD